MALHAQALLHLVPVVLGGRSHLLRRKAGRVGICESGVGVGMSATMGWGMGKAKCFPPGLYARGPQIVWERLPLGAVFCKIGGVRVKYW